MKKFNVTGVCNPTKHYMVDISNKLKQISDMVEEGFYFTINRARQYGKTTTLSLLKRALSNEFMVVKISFEGFSEESFETTGLFCKAFLRQMKKTLSMTLSKEEIEHLIDDNIIDFESFSDHITKMCTDNKIVLVFLTYIKPLINGEGFYHIESELTDLRKMDLVVDYGKDQFIIELKLWTGKSNHNKAYEQLLGYMNHKNAKTGYLLTFDLRKTKNKKSKSEWITFEEKQIFDVIL